MIWFVPLAAWSASAQSDFSGLHDQLRPSRTFQDFDPLLRWTFKDKWYTLHSSCILIHGVLYAILCVSTCAVDLFSFQKVATEHRGRDPLSDPPCCKAWGSTHCDSWNSGRSPVTWAPGTGGAETFARLWTKGIQRRFVWLWQIELGVSWCHRHRCWCGTNGIQDHQRGSTRVSCFQLEQPEVFQLQSYTSLHRIVTETNLLTLGQTWDPCHFLTPNVTIRVCSECPSHILHWT